MEKKIFLALLPTFFASCFLFLVAPFLASAADLSFAPSLGNYEIGSVFSVKVQVVSPGQSVNAASATISFPKDKLEITSLSKSGSIFGIWVQEPSFSNADGTIKFEGIVLNPGFTGDAGKIITINFKAKQGGLASLDFTKASVLANDGKGTEVLKNSGSAQLTITAPPQPGLILAPVVSATKVPVAPKVTSLSHPESTKWYAVSDVALQWKLPQDVIDISFLLDVYPKTNTEKPRELVTSYTYKNIEDGIWYFHIKFKNKYGWGPTTHMAVNVDTQKPKPIFLIFPHGTSSLDNRPVALFNTTDSLSGIDYYDIKIGDKYSYQLLPDAVASSNPYVIPPQEPGNYSLRVLAYDKAGNFVEATGSFEVIALDMPQIISMPEKIYEGDFFRINGRSYPKATVVAVLKNDGQTIQEENAFVNTLGQFTLTWPTYLKNGNYTLSFFVVDENEAKSLQTPQRPLLVEKKYVVNFAGVRITLSMLIWLCVLVFLVINSLIGYWIVRFSLAKSHFNRRFLGVETQLNELIVYLTIKLTKDDLKKFGPRVKKSITKMKKILNDIHTS